MLQPLGDIYYAAKYTIEPPMMMGMIKERGFVEGHGSIDRSVLSLMVFLLASHCVTLDVRCEKYRNIFNAHNLRVHPTRNFVNFGIFFRKSVHDHGSYHYVEGMHKCICPLPIKSGVLKIEKKGKGQPS